MKSFVPCRAVRDNGIQLAHKIYTDGFVPDVIYVSLRGGAYLGNVISEYFKLVSATHNLKPVLYAAVVARSYDEPPLVNPRGNPKGNPRGNSRGTPADTKVSVDGWTYDPKYLRNGDRVLLVDDIYDTGNTIAYLANVIMENGVSPDHLKIAVHDYKECLNPLPIYPDYYCNKISLREGQPSHWIHYLSHELVGLTKEEITEHYAAEAQAILTDQHSNSPPRYRR